MSGTLSSLKKEMEISMTEELYPGGQGQGQEHLVMAEMVDHGCQSLDGGSQCRQKLESKTAGSTAVPPIWNTPSPRPKKVGTREPREPSHRDAYAQEIVGGFRSVRFQYDRSEKDLAEMGLEELSGLEMEVMRRQLRVITGRLLALEDEDSTRRHRETLIFIILMSACMANLWLWMHR